MARMPVLFIGHGSPMNAIENNPYSVSWIEVGKALPLPKAILCISAHWESSGTQVTAMEKPKTIHDFYGFPPELYAQNYPALGSPGFAERVKDLLKPMDVDLDHSWGLDHGTWSVLTRLFPKANVPVVQLSLDVHKSAQEHYGLGKSLLPLRDEGVLILGSGNIVHNLRIMHWGDSAFDWAEEFDVKIKQWILASDHESIIKAPLQEELAALAINSGEHYKPLLYALGAIKQDEPIQFFTEKVTLGSISMRSLKIG